MTTSTIRDRTANGGGGAGWQQPRPLSPTQRIQPAQSAGNERSQDGNDNLDGQRRWLNKRNHGFRVGLPDMGAALRIARWATTTGAVAVAEKEKRL